MPFSISGTSKFGYFCYQSKIKVGEMMLEVGQKYYIESHAYYHFLCEVASIDGSHKITTGRCVRIHSDPRGWDLFFSEGCGESTVYTKRPDGSTLTVMNAYPWIHEIPQK